jgi:uridine kinase
LLPNPAPQPRVLIDGRSGSGKTEFAALLVAAWPGAQLVRLDDLYPGWNGLEAGSALVHTRVLGELRWQRWDWAANQPAEWHTLDPTRPIVVEGCGALSIENRRVATLGLWVDLDDATRKARALARDGASYAPHWDEWAAQEEIFIARESPRERADAIINGVDVAAAVPLWRTLAAAPAPAPAPASAPAAAAALARADGSGLR